MDKIYDPHKYEREIYQRWEKSGAFSPTGKGKPFTIIMPPPNANASLHAGHGMYTIEDVLIRWKRMQGYSTLWLSGMDHAGFETQYVYEKHLAKKGKSRMDFDRQALYSQVAEFVQENSGLIYQQFKRLGFSADWSRSVFSLDRRVVKRVFGTFRRMADEGLVYRGSYLVNYCSHCGTSLSELEVKHQERRDPLYYLKYGPFVLATVRPETKFGDTGVAVHPKDQRYQKYVGQEIEVEGLLGKFKMKVIADSFVDPKFGTGVVKITPHHDPNDFEVWKRHPELPPPKSVIDLSGRLNQNCGQYAGLKTARAREMVAADLEKAGLLVKIDHHYLHSVAICYKCGRDLEPTAIPNWFIKVKSLKPAVIAAIQSNEVRFIPPRFKKQILQWMKMMHDWPISRQIAWGIRIPAWYRVKDNPNLQVTFLDKEHQSVSGRVEELLKNYELKDIQTGLQTLSAPNDASFEISEAKPGDDYLQETDTFDTWFSSGQWPLVTLKDSEYKTRLPTDVMGTLSDILPFWVSRMIMFSLYLKKVLPFKAVYLWSMVADAQGVKMSKSKGNVINPIDLIDKYGADALRMTLLYGVAPGSAIPLSENKVRGMRNFSNKIWNIARFALSGNPKTRSFVNFSKRSLQNREQDDRRILEELNKTVAEVTKSLEKYQFGMAAEKLYEFVWHKFADVYLEKVKNRQEKSFPVLFHVLITCLKLLHPFMPFVSEAIWQIIRSQRSEAGSRMEEMLMTAKWPESQMELRQA